MAVACRGAQIVNQHSDINDQDLSFAIYSGSQLDRLFISWKTN